MRVKELVRRRTTSRFVVAGFDKAKDLRDFAEVWQAKGLDGEGQ